MYAGPLWAARQRAKGKDWTLVEGLTAAAMPAGITTRHAYETLRDELLQDLRNAGPVDVALFGLHGAMVADGYDDCEGDLLRRAREIVGPDTVIGAELDPHCHLTATMMESADLIVCYKEYPIPTSWTAPMSWSTCAWPRPRVASGRRAACSIASSSRSCTPAANRCAASSTS